MCIGYHSIAAIPVRTLHFDYPFFAMQNPSLATFYANMIVVLQPIAEAACKKYKKKIVAIGGLHIDNATKEEIDLLVKNCNSFVKNINK